MKRNIKRPEVLIVIPAYNEAKVIANVIGDTRKHLKNAGITADILVVNDCSLDKTTEKARIAGASVIPHILNTGAGGATQTGLVYAHLNDYSYVATMDADGQHSPEDVVKGLKLIKNSEADLLIGSRVVNTKNMSWAKRMGNAGLSIITFLLFGVRVGDSQSGLRFFSKKAIKELRWRSLGYEFCSEMLWRANQQRLIVREFPAKIIYTDYSKSKGQSNWNGVIILKRLVAQRIMEVFS